MTNLDNIQSFGVRLQEALGGGSYKEITEFLNANGLTIDYENVRRYIIGERKPDYEILTQLAKIANVSIHWLLTGMDWTDKNEKQSRSPEYKVWRNPVWNRFTLDELNALKTLADYHQISIEDAVHLLTIEGLKLREFLSNPIPLPIFSLSNFNSSQLCSAELWGEIGAENRLIVKNETVSVPEELRPQDYVNEDGLIHPSRFHAFRVITEQLSSQGIQGGDLIVCCTFSSIFGWTNIHHNSRPFLVPQDGNTKMPLRRVYRDVINTSRFIFRPVRDFQPVERFKIKVAELEYIFGVVTE